MKSWVPKQLEQGSGSYSVAAFGSLPEAGLPCLSSREEVAPATGQVGTHGECWGDCYIPVWVKERGSGGREM